MVKSAVHIGSLILLVLGAYFVYLKWVKKAI